MAKKAIKKIIKLNIPAGKANPAPPIGPALGGAGVNIMAFCKEHNAYCLAKKDEITPGDVVPTVITVYEDKTFTFITKITPTSILIKKAAGVEVGSKQPNKEKVGKLTEAQVREIVKKKAPDLRFLTEEAGMAMIKGTARSMGIDVVKGG